MISRTLASTALLSCFVAYACGGGSASDTTPSGPGAGGSATSGGKSGAAATAGKSHGAGGSAGASGAGGSGGTSNAGASGSGGASGGAGKSGAAANAGKSGAGGGKGGTAGQGGAIGSGGAGGTSGSSGASSGAGGAGTCTSPIALVVSPPGATIDVVNGVASPVTFTATGVCTDGSMSPLAAAWSFDRLDLAVINPGSGVLTPNATKGGTGTVTATAGSLMGQAPVTITLHIQDNPSGSDPAQQMMLQTPTDPGASGTLLYPYDQTVFARGILAPEIQWNGGAPGDLYWVHIKEQYLDAQFFVNADPPSRFLMSDAAWEALTVTNGGEDVSVDVTRMSNGVVYQPMHETWKIAQGSLRGSIYYWAVNLGQIVKIAPGASSPSTVFDSGPIDQLGSPAPGSYDGTQPPWQDAGTGKRCVACHVVSKDGSTLASVFSTPRGSTGPWGSVSLSTGSIQALSSYLENTTFEALTPDGRYVVANTSDMRMHLAQSATGSNLPSALDAIADHVCDPAFSHDGTKLAFAGNVQGSYPVEFFASTLDLFDFDEPSTTFSNRRTIVNGNGQAIAFPSFSPGSDMIVYQRGDYSRAKYGNGQWGKDDLYLVGANMQLPEQPLSRANGEGYLDPKNQHLNYQPTVNPIAVGGYFWVVFVSPRDYGNEMVSASNPTYENRKQLWVAAIDLNAQPGQDPSHPAFYLRGQDLTTVNMSGYWSLEACHQNGNACNEGYECCSGYCEQDSSGHFSCVDMPSGGCSAMGEKCSSDADCCDLSMGAQCIGGFCAKQKP